MEGRQVSTGMARVGLIGAHGFGLVHRRNLARLQGLGHATLVAVAEPSPLQPGELPDGVRTYSDAAALLAAEHDLDVVIVSTPLHTHFGLAEAVLASGADLYLEKPPVTSLEQFDRLRMLAAERGRRVQVGFQSLGSHTIPWLRAAIEAGEFGDVRAVTATGLWTRSRAYFSRSPWAGRRTLDGVDVVDGVATNALSHAVITALTVAGARRASDLERVEVDLHRANPTESDDTTVVRVRRPAPEPDVTCALTLCGPEEAEPYVTVHGSAATATFFYVTDEVRVDAGGSVRIKRFDRTDLLENLLDARAGRSELLSPLDGTEAYMSVLEAVRTGPEPHPIPERFVDRIGSGDDEHIVIRGIEEAVLRACAAEATFTELGLPWAAQAAAADDALRVDGRPVAELRSGDAVAASLSPRPYLHPVRTLAGVALTDHFPIDHAWHLGVGVAMPDVGGTNLWGGPDYRSDGEGYRWRRTHGTIRRAAEDVVGSDTLRQRLTWCDPDGAALVDETREWTFAAIDSVSWRLDLRFTLTAAGGPVELGSPGSHGRAGAGYGGFFWRFAPCRNVEVRTAEATGEEAVNGSRAPWLSWTAEFADGPASVRFAAPPESDDPWFVRVSDYPGVGSALAWDRPLRLGEEPVMRTIAMVVGD
ncbi:oxidoreductase, NAD-binding domain protein [Leifsonia aquatica ATCC 14665]|uniref:Oxidoreductase, NAD-binding domain protein n=1 Tax=Leifsonia aquatica ATCC 14665 TaxID=1358026 RepID=U2R381_LEIAQ|nr:oxidoreductase, NAD-binding domain protein [Leifsonia aquatica ATCC 14665]